VSGRECSSKHSLMKLVRSVCGGAGEEKQGMLVGGKLIESTSFIDMGRILIGLPSQSHQMVYKSYSLFRRKKLESSN
jgi:hypothetical protein